MIAVQIILGPCPNVDDFSIKTFLYLDIFLSHNVLLILLIPGNKMG